MKITVITVCLNSARTIEKAIKSIISQEYANKEYIIIDGGSTDGTLEIIQKYAEYITKWISEKDNGIFDAMNKGIRMATGDIIAFLNSDDWYQEEILSCIAENFKKEDDCLCFNNYIADNNQITLLDTSIFPTENVYIHMPYYHSAIFARREFFEKENNFDTTYKIAADYDWFLKSYIKGMKIRHIAKPAFVFCNGGVSTVNKIECAKEAKEIALRYVTGSENQNDYTKKIMETYNATFILNYQDELIRKELLKIVDGKDLFIWGAGIRGKQTIQWLRSYNIGINAVVDTNSDKWGEFILNHKIQNIELLEKKSGVLIITPDNYGEEILKKIASNKYDNINKILLKNLWAYLVGVVEKQSEES